MRDINLGTCATIVGTTTACTPLPPSNVEICLCHTASSGHLCFSTLLGGRGALGSGERGTWERIGSFFKSSKDLLHYSMLFLEMSQVFLIFLLNNGQRISTHTLVDVLHLSNWPREHFNWGIFPTPVQKAGSVDSVNTAMMNCRCFFF